MTDQRKIVQIVVTPTDGGILYALCDDGTVFAEVWKNGVCEWRPLPPIPQSEVDDDERF